MVIVLVAAWVAGRITAVPGVPAMTSRPTIPVPARRQPADETETEIIG